MRYGVLSQLTQPQGRVTCPIDATVPDGVGTQFRGPVTGCVVLTNTGSVVSARGRLHAVALCDCGRCLAPHEVALDIELNEECSLSQIERPSVEDEENQLIPLLDADTVDLTELVRQVLVVHVPPRSLCRPDCAGICTHCGANLNDGPCGCGGPADPRFSGLEALRGDEQQSDGR
jgi:uncharacterized protein